MRKNTIVNGESRTESQAIYVALAGAGTGFIVGVLAFLGKSSVPIFARELSLGVVVSTIAGIAALIVCLATTLRREVPTKQNTWIQTKRILGAAPLALVFGLLVFMLYALVFYVVSMAFKGAGIDMWAASVLLALSVGVATYATYLMTAGMNSLRVSVILALFLVSGTFISMTTASDPYWWDTHFSSLGAGGGVSGYAFNATLIIAGLVMVALSRYITNDFTRLQQQGRISKKAKAALIQALLTGIGIALAFVGLFVYDAYPLIHNISAFGMAALFIVIIIMLPWLVPGFLPAFFVASYGLVGGLVVSAWLFWGVDYFNLTIFELVAAAIIFAWLVLFVRHVAALLSDETQSSPTLAANTK